MATMALPVSGDRITQLFEPAGSPGRRPSISLIARRPRRTSEPWSGAGARIAPAGEPPVTAAGGGRMLVRVAGTKRVMSEKSAKIGHWVTGVEPQAAAKPCASRP